MYVPIVLLIIIPLTNSCNSFIDTTVTILTSAKVRETSLITGCLERRAFPDRNVLEINIKKTVVPQIERDSIRHFSQLYSLTIEDCGVQHLAVDLFRNVPKLRVVRIVRNQLTNFSKGVLNNLDKLEILDLSRNNISSIESSAFDRPTLKEVNLGYNRLTYWSDNWFNASDLEVINLTKNFIKTLPRRAFFKMKFLKKISLNYNRLESISTDAFADLTNLLYLGVKHNRLKVLNPRSFPNNLRIKNFEIDGNFLNYLSTILLEKLNVNSLSLVGNPWQCPCLEIITGWLFDHNTTLFTPKVCRRSDMPICFGTETCHHLVDDADLVYFFETMKQIRPEIDKMCFTSDSLIIS